MFSASFSPPLFSPKGQVSPFKLLRVKNEAGELPLLHSGVRPGRNLQASNVSQVQHCCQRLLSPAKPHWHSVISYYYKETDIEGACAHRLGENRSKHNIQLPYFTPQFNYANHSPYKGHGFTKRMSPGLPITEMQRRKRDKSICYLLSTYYELDLLVRSTLYIR